MQFKDFLTFDRLIAGEIVRILYWLGLVIIVLFVFGSVAGSIDMMGRNAWLGLAQLVFALGGGALMLIFWRVVCEMYLVFVSMNERLKEISAKTTGATLSD